MTLRRIGDLLESGLNLAGIRMVLVLEADNRCLEQDLTEARSTATFWVKTSPKEARNVKGIR